MLNPNLWGVGGRGGADENVLVCVFVYYGYIVDSVDASEFNDKPEGGGDRAAQHLTPELL